MRINNDVKDISNCGERPTLNLGVVLAIALTRECVCVGVCRGMINK